MTRRLLTLMDCAREMGRSREFVRALIADEKVDARRERGRWYITEASLDRYVASGSPEPELEPVALMPRVVLARPRRRVAE